MPLISPLRNPPAAISPYRCRFVQMTMEQMATRQWDWARLNSNANLEAFGAEYNLNKRLRGTLPLKVEHIARLADAFELSGERRDAYLMVGLLAVSPPELGDMLARGVPMPVLA